MERANLQLALDALRADAAMWDEVGLTPDIGNYGGGSLVGMVAGTWHGPGATGRQYRGGGRCRRDRRLPGRRRGPDSVRGRPRRAAAIRERPWDEQRAGCRGRGSRRGRPAPVPGAGAGLDGRARDARQGHDLLVPPPGDFGIRFVHLPDVTRDDVILDEAVLAAIERHALGITGNVDALRTAGQHVKRGLLLFGPPGTGKTHTVSYLLNA